MQTNSEDGTIISYEKSGQGPALILVDGAMCSRAFGPSKKLAALLVNHFTVYTYDRRGRNESGNTQPYAADKEVEDLEALIKAIGSPVYMAGLSSGAALALRATAAGLNVTKLAMYEPPFLSGMGGHEPPRDSKEQLEKRIAANRRGDAVKFFMHDMIGLPSLFTAIFPLTPVWSKLKSVAHTLPYDTAIMGDYTIPKTLAASVKIPVLVGGGTKSPASMHKAVQETAKAFPNAKLEMLKGQNHNASNTSLASMFINFFTN